MKLLVLSFLSILLLSVCPIEAAETTHTILLIGDSTVEDRGESARSHGWGAFLQNYLNAPWKVVNCAESGASTKTFLNRAGWTKAKEVACDYLFIQFGHNDAHPKGRPESTDAATDYRQFLRDYITYARSKGAKPVLITPMHRRTFEPDGKLRDRLKRYAEAVKAVAVEMNVPLIDLHVVSGEKFLELGDAGSEDLTALNDRTHFSRKGADWLASEVAAQAQKIDATLGVAFAPKPDTQRLP